MFNCRFYLFCLVRILCICLCVGSSNIKRCTETDKQALLKLKDGFIGESDILSSWKGDDCCNWEGISCNNLTGRVTKMDLLNMYESSALRGMIDSSICELQHLTFLDLSFNHLEGKIPNCIGSLGQLIKLRLKSNKLVGAIPHALGNLSNLQTLDLGFNDYLAANNLEWVSHLSNLRYLDLSNVNLGGAIDWLSSISKIPSLLELSLDHCGLPQVNPISIPLMNCSTSLKILSLRVNNLNTSTLSWMLNVSKVLTVIDLSHNSLQQSIPDGFANAISLQHLDLSYNELEGTIPKSFQSLCQLKLLWLSNNKLSGQLSDYIQQLCSAQNGIELNLSDNPLSSGPLPDFSRLTSLKTLSLRNTSIVGPLPQSFGRLPYLATLDLSHNQLSGSLSLLDVTELVSLEYLYLSYNQLNGTLPHTIGQLSSLRMLDLSSNKLTGVISEAHLSNLSTLQRLEVAQNSLSFNLNSSWVPPFQLSALYASSCILGPNFPAWLKHQRELRELEISDCGISDSFPKWFWDLSSGLSYLNVSHNKLSGALPKAFSSQISELDIDVWDLSFNNFSGPVPNFPPQLRSLLLSNNLFSGSISSFCATSQWDLTYLDLSSNLLAGQLFDCWGQFQRLKVLNLAKNNFSGRIPKSFGTLQQIESIHLNKNNFSGEIPSLTLCSNLKFIDFGDNNLQGSLPEWVGHNLHHLIVLRLQANKFQGSIPASLCNLLHLQVLDLSKNNITGKIPQCLSHIIALSSIKFPRETISYAEVGQFIAGHDEIGMFIDKAILAWKGENREYEKNLGLMTAIDLSYNHLTGEIPLSITTLVALAALNLSGNNLTGFIPNNIGHMEMLESLDLSRNYLYGRIPASLSNLSFLSYMNLSFNNLSGEIPVSTQLETFDASTYVGNNGLCGPPIKKQCAGDENSPNPPHTGSTDRNGTNDDEDQLITFGFYVSLGFGVIVGFWGVCGTLFFKSSWRHAYFLFFNKMNDWIYVQLAVFMARMKRRLQVQD